MEIPYGGKMTILENGQRVHAPWHYIDDDLLVVFDQMHPGMPTVKSCVEQVVEQLATAKIDKTPVLSGRRVLYRDHEGRFGEVFVHAGEFAGGKSLGVHDLEQAVSKVRGCQPR